MIKIKMIKKSRAATGGFFTKALNKFLNKKAESSIRPRKRVIRPSELGYCERKIVMSILNIFSEPPVAARVQRIFDNGNKVHNRYLRHYLDKMEDIDVLHIEDNFKDEGLWLKGSPDAVIADKNTKEEYVFELKSIKGEDFDELVEPMEVHEAQARIYMYLTGVKKAIVFYENKNTQETKEFVLSYDKKKEQELIDKCKRFISYVNNYDQVGELPDSCRDRRCKACHQ